MNSDNWTNSPQTVLAHLPQIKIKLNAILFVQQKRYSEERIDRNKKKYC